MKREYEIVSMWEELRYARLKIELTEDLLRSEKTVSTSELRADINAAIRLLDSAKRCISNRRRDTEK